MNKLPMKILVAFIGIFFVAVVIIFYLQGVIDKDIKVQLVSDVKKPDERIIEIEMIAPDPIYLLRVSDREDVLNRKLEMAQEAQKSKDKSIDYYGKIIDQYGQPVPNVTIKASIRYFGSIVNAGFLPSNSVITRETDEAGRFSINDESGLTLRFKSFSKQGYVFQQVDPINYSAGISEFRSAEHPNIISAYKLGEAPDKLLLGKAKYYSLVPDGRIYSLDLINKKMQEGNSIGHIRVAYTFTEGSTELKPSDWAVTLEANGGGIIETKDTLMYEAPETGYQSKWTANIKRDSSEWTTRLKRKFYLRAHNGKIYARLEIKFFPFYGGKTLVKVKYWINQEGSRNLYSTKQPY